MENKNHVLSLEDIKDNLINDNTMGVLLTEKLELILSFDHNVRDIIYKICKRITTLHQKSKI